jgi:hypothetical protein
VSSRPPLIPLGDGEGSGRRGAGDREGRDRRVPPSLSAALSAEAAEVALHVCSQCGQSVAWEEFVPYDFDLDFEDIAEAPDNEALAPFGEGECETCHDDAPRGGLNSRCERCGLAWGEWCRHCLVCEGRMRQP